MFSLFYTCFRGSYKSCSKTHPTSCRNAQHMDAATGVLDLCTARLKMRELGFFSCFNGFFSLRVKGSWIWTHLSVLSERAVFWCVITQFVWFFLNSLLWLHGVLFVLLQGQNFLTGSKFRCNHSGCSAVFDHVWWSNLISGSDSWMTWSFYIK